MKNNNNNNNNYERSGNSSSKKGKIKCTSIANNNSNSNSNNTSNNLEKPRQPQRGLGVAQLEKIRLHTQMASCGLIPPHPFLNPAFQHIPDDIRFQLAYHQGVAPPPQQQQQPCWNSSPSVPPSAYGYNHPNAFMMGIGDHIGTGNVGYNESQLCKTARWTEWNPINNIRVTQESQQPDLLPLSMVTRHLLSQVEQQNRNDESIESMNSGNQNSELRENEELDLELKL